MSPPSLLQVNLKEQGALIRQEEFLVTFRKKKCFRHVFLFQELVLFSKTRKTEVGNETYEYKQSFKTCDIGLTQNSGDSGLCFEIWFRKRKSQDTYTLQAESRGLKDDWTRDLERILWDQALRNKEVRMQERLFLGLGNKPFMDIQPSDAAIDSRAVNCGLLGKDSRAVSVASFLPPRSRDLLPVTRQMSIGSCSSSSSSSSGRGSLSPGRYLGGPLGGAVRAGHPEDELDQESDRHNPLLDGSWCEESVSAEGDDAPSLCSSHNAKHPELPRGKCCQS
ncbi:puratrophin-1-like [Eucyclogobius newberryi]|uniref:puratrophin-1-like n=1 Tax=Eucyclogobius newberryi TaxID=166745 RepID=UPI003B5A82E2